MNSPIPIRLISRFIQENSFEFANRIELYHTFADLSFWQDDCDKETLRQVKRLFGPMKVVEASWGDKYLSGEYHPDGEEYYFKATIYGAYRCEIVDQKIVEEAMTDAEIEGKKREAAKLLKEIETGFKEKVITTRKCEPV